MSSVSVILCSYNRCKDLLVALQSLREMEVPPGIEWEVLVMDNNSTDDTAPRVREFISDDPHFKYFFEPNQGKTYALNRGIAESTGDILAFTDDDVRVDRRWIESIVDTFTRFSAVCVGGRVQPVWGSRSSRLGYR